MFTIISCIEFMNHKEKSVITFASQEQLGSSSTMSLVLIKFFQI